MVALWNHPSRDILASFKRRGKAYSSAGEVKLPACQVQIGQHATPRVFVRRCCKLCQNKCLVETISYIQVFHEVIVEAAEASSHYVGGNKLLRLSLFIQVRGKIF